jgi:hypothetical protein
MEQPLILSENETRLYSDLEIDLLIDEISEAALEAIEQAAGEAARAAVLSLLEREAAAVREAAIQRANVIHWQNEAAANKQAKVKTAIITGVICLLSGFTAGIIIGVTR